jgi:hypothetical protein
VFLAILLTAPVIGDYIYGQIKKRWMQYLSPVWARFVCFMFFIVFFGSVFFVPAINDLNYLALLLWFVFFLSSLLEPLLTNVTQTMIAPVEINAGTTTSALSMTLLGLVPAPLVYGIVSDKSSETAGD